MDTKINLLWIDDDIDKFGVYVDVLKAEGYNVFIASNYEETTKIIDQHAIDVFLVDIHIPNINGIEIIRRIYKAVPYAKFAVLSSFLYLQKNKNELKSLDISVQLIDKYLTNVKGKSFKEKFLLPIKSLCSNGVTFCIKDFKDSKINKEDIDPFDISFAKFMQLSIIEKDKLADLAEQKAYKTIDNAFKRGKIWVLICGNSNEITASAEHEQDIPTEEQVLKISKIKNRAPFQFSNGLVSEDHWMNCSIDESLIDYPTVTLEISGKELILHFDTGCPSTKFSYEELISIGAIPNATHFITEWRNGIDKYKCVIMKNVTAILKNQNDGQTTPVVLSGKAIRDWYEHSYSRKCKSSCKFKNKDITDSDYCILRKALIGRNLLIENKLKLALDGSKKMTYFIK